jgi:hypothetical protein
MPQPVQPQLITVSAILFSPQEGRSDSSPLVIHALSRASRSTSNHYHTLPASSHVRPRCMPDPAHPRALPWGSGRQRGSHPRLEWGSAAFSSARMVFSWRAGCEYSNKSGHFSHHFRRGCQALVRARHRPQVQWIQETRLY